MIFIALSSLLNGKTYFVSPSGNNSNPGTLALPWLTWSKAFSSATGGDTVYFRGGVYPSSGTGASAENVVRSGSPDRWLHFFNYPDEEPILDCSNRTSTQTNYFRAITVWNVSYIHFKGLTVRNARQLPIGSGYTYTSGFDVYKCHHLIIENIKVHDIQGPCFGINGCNEVYVKNCDAWNSCDRYARVPGQNGVGFQWNTSINNFDETMYQARNYFEGCRAWNCSDNGFDGFGQAYVEMRYCWAFNTGELYGEGCGFKYGLGVNNNINNPLNVLIANCISANNGFYGFSPNNNNGEVFNGHYLNNFAFHNGYKKDLLNLHDYFGVGFLIFNYSDPSPAPNELYANNISYKNEYRDIVAADNYIHRNNSWDIQVTLTDNDFLSLDWTEMLRPRKPDGSLPDINFGRLAPGSDLIDKGIDVGLSYGGKAPDLGAFESGQESGAPQAPLFISASVENSTPSILELTYNMDLAAPAPAPSAFRVRVNSGSVAVNNVTILGKKVLLQLSNPIKFGDIVTVDYSKPVINPLKATSGGEAASLSGQPVKNNVLFVNSPPVIVVKLESSYLSGFVAELDASGSYDTDHDNLTFQWTVPDNVSVSSTSLSKIKMLCPVVNETKTLKFIVKASDGISVQSKTVTVKVIPYRPELEAAEIINIEASSSFGSYLPTNILD